MRFASWAFSWAVKLEENACAQEVLAWTAVVLWWDTHSFSPFLSSRKHLAKLLLCSPSSALGHITSQQCVCLGRCLPKREMESEKGRRSHCTPKAGQGCQHCQSLPVCRTSGGEAPGPQPWGRSLPHHPHSCEGEGGGKGEG